MIEVNNVQYTYRSGRAEIENTALAGIDLIIQPGEFVALVGPNGSGKSTLAKHLNGLLVPNSGNVLVDGMDTANPQLLWEIRQRVGMLFQNPDNQLVAAVVEEDIAFGPENLGIPPSQIRQRVDEALTVVGMEAYRLHPPHLLSGGQKQRVAIAGILALRPAYLVLDEPTAMLDPPGRKEIISTILQLNRELGLTVVLVTHFMEEAALANRILVMTEGKVCLEGTPRQVFSQPGVLKQVGLDVPQITSLAHQLRDAGLELAADVLTVEELVDAICSLD